MHDERLERNAIEVYVVQAMFEASGHYVLMKINVFARWALRKQLDEEKSILGDGGMKRNIGSESTDI